MECLSKLKGFVLMQAFILCALLSIHFSLLAQATDYELVPAVDSSTVNNMSPVAFQTSLAYPNENRLYFGTRLGGVFVAGMNLMYMHVRNNRPTFYFEGAAQTTLLINSLNGAAGIFITDKLSVTMRYHWIYRNVFESEYNGHAWAPELSWFKPIGMSRKKMINLRAGVVIEEVLYPDISFGIIFPLNNYR
ncbi:MAG: hypothetical protein ACFCUU_14360 [Cyclobacteriaceae bacterium]